MVEVTGIELRADDLRDIDIASSKIRLEGRQVSGKAEANDWPLKANGRAGKSGMRGVLGSGLMAAKLGTIFARGRVRLCAEL